MQDLQAFLRQRLALKGRDPDLLGPQTSLFLSGLLDSLDAMETVVFLEENYGRDFSAGDFDISQIDSLEAMRGSG